MAKIVVLSVPAFGHINPVLPILAFGRPVKGVALRQAVVKILADPGFAERSGALGESIRTAGGWRLATKIIENIAVNQ